MGSHQPRPPRFDEPGRRVRLDVRVPLRRSGIRMPEEPRDHLLSCAQERAEVAG